MNERNPRPPKKPFPSDLTEEIREYFDDIVRQAALEAIRDELERNELHRTVIDVSTEWRVKALHAAQKIDAGPKRRTGKAPSS
jgi:hypothetical protein